MKTIGLFEAKQERSELVERASTGEQIGIARRASLPPPLFQRNLKRSLKEVFDDIEEIRKSVSRSKPFTVKQLIEGGRS